MTRHLRSFLIIALLLAAVPRAAHAQTTEALLDTLQHTGVMYFWNEANPANGLIKDRSTPGSFCSIAANGFGFSAIIIGVERGWLDKAQARTRTLTTLQTGLVASIAYLSGRKMEKRTATEFFGALGMNLGAAFALREAARALIKYVAPGAGSVISAGVAFTGTMALGAAARSYFV